jgi:hypothetical protein
MKTALFFLRLALYLGVCSLPFLHPAIAVPYDRVGLLFWFLLVPAEVVLAFFFAPPRLRLRGWLLAAGLPVAAFLLFVSGLELASLYYLLGACAAFLLTVLIFRSDGFGRGLAALEPFLLALIGYRLLSFSRASEQLARQASGLTQTILTLIPLAFLLHETLIYLAAFHRRGSRRDARELALFLGAAVPLFLLFALVLPPDFVRHRVVLNRIDRDVQPRPVPLNERGQGWEEGNLLGQFGSRRQGGEAEGEEQGEQGEGQRGQGGRNALQGIPSDQWGEGGFEQGQGEGEGGKQYAVMVVASKVQPVYAGGLYYGLFDAERGFLLSRDEPLNELAYLRFLETWRDPQPPADARRRPVQVSFVSTLPERYLAYRPESIEPTVLRQRYSPFQYSYASVSALSISTPADWMSLPELSPEERLELAPFLQLPLSESRRAAFEGYLREALQGQAGGAQAQAQGQDQRAQAQPAPPAQEAAGGEVQGGEPGYGQPRYGERIMAILKSFSSYRYELGFDDDTSVAKMESFLFEKKVGDCTEFSNSAAILLRLAGIPSRVVTGYLASRELQSFAHLQGLFVLRQAIPELQEFPLQELYLVTTAQHHSWVQAYLPTLGWVDLEATAFAIPPPPGRNPSSMDVVIPLIQGAEQPVRFRFPWLWTLRLLSLLGAAALAGMYLFRYGREAYLSAVARGEDTRALRSLYRLLLLRLSARGYGLKAPSQTPLEYAAQHPELEGFAALYTRLRYQDSLEPAQRGRLWGQLRESYRRILAESRRPGLLAGLRRLFSLRALRYQ